MEDSLGNLVGTHLACFLLLNCSRLSQCQTCTSSVRVHTCTTCFVLPLLILFCITIIHSLRPLSQTGCGGGAGRDRFSEPLARSRHPCPPLSSQLSISLKDWQYAIISLKDWHYGQLAHILSGGGCTHGGRVGNSNTISIKVSPWSRMRWCCATSSMRGDSRTPHTLNPKP